MRVVIACTLFAVVGFGLPAGLGAQDDAKKEEARPAERERPQPERMMKEWDKNGDGKLTVDEIPADRKDFFLRVRTRADQDGDEALSLDELQKAFAAFRERPADAGERPARPAGGEGRAEAPPRDGPPGFFRLLDANGDGKLTSEELAKAPELVARLDRDGDGALSPRELLGGGPRQEGGPAAEKRPEGAPAANDRPIARLLREMDKNGDGKISREEAQGRVQRRFERLDANKDGQLDRSELEKMAEQLRERAGGAREGGGQNPEKKEGAGTTEKNRAL